MVDDGSRVNEAHNSLKEWGREEVCDWRRKAKTQSDLRKEFAAESWATQNPHQERTFRLSSDSELQRVLHLLLDIFLIDVRKNGGRSELVGVPGSTENVHKFKVARREGSGELDGEDLAEVCEERREDEGQLKEREQRRGERRRAHLLESSGEQ